MSWHSPTHQSLGGLYFWSLYWTMNISFEYVLPHQILFKNWTYSSTHLHTGHLLALCLVTPWWPTSATVWTKHWTESWWLFCILEFSIWVSFTLFLFVRFWAGAWTGLGSRAWLWPETKISSVIYILVSWVVEETRTIRSSSERVVHVVNQALQHVW